MNIVLFKKLVEFTDKKTGNKKSFYQFYLRLDNGSKVRVLPNTWEDDKKQKHSNYNELCLIAVDELPFDK